MRQLAVVTQHVKLQQADEFFALLESRPDMSLEEIAREAHEKYPDIGPEIFSAIFQTGDPLLVHNSLPFAQLGDPRLAEVFKRFIREADPQRYELTFVFLATQREMKPELKAKKNLPESVRAALTK